MWYVMQVISGREEHTVLMVKRTLSRGILKYCFVPMRRMKKKYRGEWLEITEKLFPGYVFLVSEQPQLLYDELKNIPALTKLLGSCEEYFTPLSDEDVRFLRKLQDMEDSQNIRVHDMRDMQNVCRAAQKELWNAKDVRSVLQKTQGEKDREKYLEVRLSRVVVGKEGKLRIISGPLKNLEGQIRKINLHKRIAVVEAEFMGSKSLIHLGIEITEMKD